MAAKAGTPDDRLERLRDRKRKLDAQIHREMGKKRDQERKARTRRLVQYGELIEIAQLDQTDTATLLGLLLDGARRLEHDATQEQWRMLGSEALARRAARNGTKTKADETHTGGEHAVTLP
jgi:hypothetical protein